MVDRCIFSVALILSSSALLIDMLLSKGIKQRTMRFPQLMLFQKTASDGMHHANAYSPVRCCKCNHQKTVPCIFNIKKLLLDCGLWIASPCTLMTGVGQEGALQTPFWQSLWRVPVNLLVCQDPKRSLL